MKSVLFPNSFFSIFIFLYSVLMVKLNFINQKACLINLGFLVLSVPNSYFLDSILMVPLIIFFSVLFSFSEILHIYIFLINKFW